MSELHDAVKLLLKRMETHPEEFPTETGYHLQGRWAKLLEKYAPFMSEAEEKAISDAKRNLCMHRMHEDIMKELLAPEENHDVDDIVKLWTQSQSQVTTKLTAAAVYPTPYTTIGTATTTDAAAARLTLGVGGDTPKGLSGALKGWFK